ncbi:hypothetical protein G7046_g1134 [Stylonectria norvegica]|nr:hypothetical protein G7046_g1134 [Stylonectria norvegica]
MAYQQPQQHAVGAPTQEWQNGLCNCSPCESCLLGTFLPCMLHGRAADRMRDPSMATADSFNSDCLLFAGVQCFTGCGWIISMMQRGEMRERFGIKGSGFGDYCTTYWCLCCAVIQQEKEAKQRLAGAHAPVTQAYQPQKEGMHMPTPQAQGQTHGQTQGQITPVQSPPPQQQHPAAYQQQQQQSVYSQQQQPAYQQVHPDHNGSFPQQQQQPAYQQVQPDHTGSSFPQQQKY